MDFNMEDALDALDNFEKEADNVSPLLEDYLRIIAKTGNILFPWNKLKPLLKRKIELVLMEFTKSCPVDSVPPLPNTEKFNFDVVKSNMLEAVDAFSNAPFTIQRLCELIVDPRKYYNRTDKYMRGLEKNLLVVSTIDSNINDSNSRNQSFINGSVNASSDPQYDETSAAESSVNVCSTSSVNGTVLENFATVFPSATRIAAPSNNIQVPVISDSNDFLTTECMGNFGYDVGDAMNTSGIENTPGENLSDCGGTDDDVSMMSEDAKDLDNDVIKNSESLDDSISECSISSSNVSSPICVKEAAVPETNPVLEEPSPATSDNITATTVAEAIVQENVCSMTDVSTSCDDCGEPVPKRKKLDCNDTVSEGETRDQVCDVEDISFGKEQNGEAVKSSTSDEHNNALNANAGDNVNELTEQSSENFVSKNEDVHVCDSVAFTK